MLQMAVRLVLLADMAVVGGGGGVLSLAWKAASLPPSLEGCIHPSSHLPGGLHPKSLPARPSSPHLPGPHLHTCQTFTSTPARPPPPHLPGPDVPFLPRWCHALSGSLPFVA